MTVLDQDGNEWELDVDATFSLDPAVVASMAWQVDEFEPVEIYEDEDGIGTDPYGNVYRRLHVD